MKEDQAKVQVKSAAVKMAEQLGAKWHASDSSTWPTITAHYTAPTAATYVQASTVTST